ncbi:AAA family ATPase [Sunxiuqinia elliptica]|uniref:NadR type nicotinamide-nucleotide adenylyltransferase n=1 Tax=Sunxiuqinia elliptica TaxID=655355 RepID=A0A4R6GPR0_9BACT|nr:ATP-binding protein [Sunxiuqinia elliptica]TDN97282.1 NadR type nicotinamide-nucleotide adenylyltransferase [Sunxiuqinia elliptica]TDO60535.1 NadR type nicotinamide-nucleotide adenylyltransferase [Sunxiuqinia elliptica]
MKRLVRIAITGPESTAKSTLAHELAEHFKGIFYPEYARQYLESQSTEYTYEDVEAITRKQIEQYHEAENSNAPFVFFDTWLIISKIWFQWVYQREPEWLENQIDELPIDLYLLCLPDIPWEPDPLRENGGEERLHLFGVYKEELIARNQRFVEVGGLGEERTRNAIRAVQSCLRS